jgi:hypothetical protein
MHGATARRCRRVSRSVDVVLSVYVGSRRDQLVLVKERIVQHAIYGVPMPYGDTASRPPAS